MLKKILLLLLLAGSSAAVFSAPLELRVVGKQVRDSNDCLIRLKGVNIPSMEWRDTGEGPTVGAIYPITVTVNEALANWGANIVRLPLSQDFWFGYANTKDGSVNLDGYRDRVDSIVNLCAANNTYVLLDLHWSGTGTWGTATDIWVMPDANAVTFWTDVATRYANNPAVLFDLFNEPHDISWSVWRDGGVVTSNSTSYTTPGMQALLTAVRNTGARNAVVVGGIDWAYDLRGFVPGYAGRPNGWALTESGGNGLIYATHIYPWKGLPWDNFVSIVSNYFPILVGEVGQEGAGQRQFTGGMPAILDWIDLHGYHWTGWSMHPGASPCMITNWAFTPTDYEGVDMKARLLATSSGQGCATPTPSFTPTPTPTGTWYTPTPTYVPDNGPEGIVLYPNPATEGVVQFGVNFEVPASELRIRIYTLASRLVLDDTRTDVATGVYTIDLRDRKGKPLSNGVYLVLFTTKTKQRLCKLMVLR